MRIINLTRDSLLADKAWEAKTIRARMKGLLGRDKLEEGQGLLIRPCTSIHSFFMRFVFDAAFIDKAGRVLHVIHSMKKWRMSKYVARADGVVELPAGVLKDSQTSVGDSLEFDE
ncbi:MAG: DUF192 domain-containing protein [Deltaproteobacteria bacterium]|nr:DUF192 domain-containing protein [Deltaproteobacteria bacterium]MBW1870458.1 DUF192 domain-containing protein [Deltaproteobacteria bacterium]